MNKLFGVGLAVLVLTGAAFGAEVADIPWDEANIQTLRSFDKEAVIKFLNDELNLDGFPVTDVYDDIHFAWSNLEGGEKYQLIVQATGRCCGSVMIFSKDASGKVSYQTLDGGIDFDKGIRDLNSDGKKELIIDSTLKFDNYRGARAQAAWTAVYRLKNGQYGEASRDFPRFYDTEELPWYEEEIAEDREKIARGVPAQNDLSAEQLAARQRDSAIALPEYLAADEMGRDKILRVLGREPKAGEERAYEWMNSGDPELRTDAVVVFADIGGHDRQLRALAADKDIEVSTTAKNALDATSPAKK